MTADLIRLEVLAAALHCSYIAVRRRFAAGKLPLPDATVDLRELNIDPMPGTHHAMAWRLETLQAWNPVVAARCAAIQAALEQHPLKAA